MSNSKRISSFPGKLGGSKIRHLGIPELPSQNKLDPLNNGGINIIDLSGVKGGKGLNNADVLSGNKGVNGSNNLRCTKLMTPSSSYLNILCIYI